jgi:hypothetical protein
MNSFYKVVYIMQYKDHLRKAMFYVKRDKLLARHHINEATRILNKITL